MNQMVGLTGTQFTVINQFTNICACYVWVFGGSDTIS